jgi:hypothetical protein
MAKELGTSPGAVKRTLTKLGIQADFVKSNCAYYYVERTEAVKSALHD